MATDVTIAIAARDGGFPAEQLKTAVMVALAESGGNELATNRNDNGTTDYGLWQINSVHSDVLKIGDWRKPTDNAKMAYRVYQKQGWTAWVAYDNKSYEKFAARAATALAVIGIIEKNIPDALDNSLGDNSKALGDFIDFISDKHNWQRAGMIVFGWALIGIAVLAIYQQVGLFEATAKTIGAVKGLVL